MIKWIALGCVVAAAVFAGACRKQADEPAAAETAPAAEAEAPAPGPSLEGKYVGGGTDADGRSYACELEVVKSRTMYDVMRRVDGGEPYAGVAILNENTFAVGFNDGRRYGVVAYNVNPDGSLEGISAYEDSTREGAERLEKK
jgi:hypothetical protein